MLTNVGITVVPACMCRPIIEFSQVVYIIDPGFHLEPAWAMWYIALIPQALVPCRPDIYAQARGPRACMCVYSNDQAKHPSLWYKYNRILLVIKLILLEECITDIAAKLLLIITWFF